MTQTLENLKQKLLRLILLLYMGLMIYIDLLLLLTLAASLQITDVQPIQSPECHRVDYNYHLLSLTWPNQFCHLAGSCDPNWHNMWDGKTLTIHGFWPSSTDPAYLTCQRENKNSYDPFCYHAYAFTAASFNDAERSALNHYWPQLGVHKDLWTHQWQKHGTCYLHIIQDVIHYQTSQLQIFRTYFLGAVAKAKNLNINLQAGQISSKSQLATKIGRKTTQFQAICQQGSHYLQQIRVCFKVTGEPGRQYVINCPYFSAECSYPIIVRGR